MIQLLRRWKVFVPMVLLGIELNFLFPLLVALIKSINVAIAWPHLVADSAVFLEQGGLTDGLHSWRALFLPVNEHRYVLSRFIAVLPRLAGEPLGAWSVVTSFLLIFGCLFVFSHCITRISCGKYPLVRLIITLAAALLFLNPWQAENLIWDINISWFFHNLLLLSSVAIMLELPARLPPWFDFMLPPCALLNGGQGYGVLIAVGIVRLILFDRRFLMPISTIITLIIISLMPISQNQVSSWQFNLAFTLQMLINWWPASGLWPIVTFGFIGFQLFRAKFEFKSWQWKRLIIFSIPVIYGLLFSLSVNLSRSSFGLAMANRESYTTPMLMIGIGGILMVWQLSIFRQEVNFIYIQIGCLLLPLFVLLPFLEVGFPRPRFFEQQRRLLAEQDRRITWFHCSIIQPGILPSNCLLTPVYDKWDLIRKSLNGKKLNFYRYGNIGAADSQKLLDKQMITDTNRVYLLRKLGSARHWIFSRKDIAAQSGDKLFIFNPHNKPKQFNIIN